jgi:hypothetical protein
MTRRTLSISAPPPFAPRARLRTGLAMLVVALVLWPGLAPAQSDDFDDGNDDGWTHYDPIHSAGQPVQNQWTFPAGAYRLQANATPNPALGPGRVASLRQDILLTNFQISVDLVDWNDSFTETATLFARVQPNPGPGASSGYLFGYVAGPGRYVQIVRVTSERTFAIQGSPPTPLTLDPSHDYRIVFSGRGTQLEGRVYQLPNTANPLVTVTATDTSYSSGTVGLLGFSLNGTVPEAVDVTFDNFSALDHVPPRLTLDDLSFGDLRLSWPLDAPGYTLQCAPVLPAASWTDVQGSLIETLDDRFAYFTSSMGGSNKFFRLRRAVP